MSSNSTWPCESTSCKYVSRVKGTPIWKCNCVKMLQIIHISPGLHHLNTSFLHMLPFSKGCLERNHSKKMPSGPQYREIVTCFVIRWKQLFSVYVMQSYQANENENVILWCDIYIYKAFTWSHLVKLFMNKFWKWGFICKGDTESSCVPRYALYVVDQTQKPA